ncbi:hypothetical protein DM558_03990 [Entomomonas moraniae]|uniref:Uncharacterized protein n=1 Tax=Entomomonas moraniae TaxID=2213226 RepID=A0A3S9XCF0_9GAMM|nr:hypothetical protein [Entomomonas moraniae]AZS49988.1 hypothetical protein DM558_03990 [Entomomonas moraniae]
MTLEIKEKILPSYIVLSYDDISDLANENHTEAFLVVSKKFFEEVLTLFNDEIEIHLPNIFYSKYPLGGWIPFKQLLDEAANFLSFIYYNDNYEFLTQLRTKYNLYELSIYTDPVVFTIKRIKK